MNKLPFYKDVEGMCIDCGKTTLRMTWEIETNIQAKLLGYESDKRVDGIRYLECVRCHKEIKEVIK